MSDACELRLGVESALLRGLVHVELREGEQLGEGLLVLASGASRVAGLEEEWQACADVAGLERGSEFSGAVIWDCRVAKSYPRRVVQ